MSADKGLLNGRCNRTACATRPATFYSSVERAHYCEDCARRINAFVPAGVPKLVFVEQSGDQYMIGQWRARFIDALIRRRVTEDTAVELATLEKDFTQLPEDRANEVWAEGYEILERG